MPGRAYLVPSTVLPGLTATPNYTTGDALGTLVTVTGVPSRGAIQTITITDHSSAVGINIDVFFANGTMTSTDNAAFGLTDAETASVVGVVQVDSWFLGGADNLIGFEGNLNIPYETQDGSLRIQCVSRGAHNLDATTDLRISVGIEY